MPFQFGDDEVVYAGRWIRVLRRPIQTPDGERHHWELVERRTHGPIVAIVALTDDDHVILLRTFRVPAKRWMLEVPAGLMDQPGESPLDTAKRELLEETGYAAARWETLMRGPYNAGLTTDEIIYFIARDARRVQPPEHEALEAMELIRAPRLELANLLANPPADTLIDVKLYALLWFLDVPRVTATVIPP